MASSDDSSDPPPGAADLDRKGAASAPATTAKAAVFAQAGAAARERGLTEAQVLRAARTPGLEGLPPSLLATVAALLDAVLAADSEESGAGPANLEHDDGHSSPGARDDG